jgi:SAM-dependent methyltransferase
MEPDMASNATERRRWNDEYWSSVWPRREQLTAGVTDLLLGRADLAVGGHVLDVGSGAGISSIAASELVGPSGSVVGADISTPLVDYAIRRVNELGITNVRFVVADLQEETIEESPFDAAISQFGVMFFDQPVAAFSNIRRHLVPGGRLTFVCWQPLDANPWHINHSLARFVPAAADLTPGKTATGPFSLADPEKTRALLDAAGWHALDRAQFEVPVTVDQDAIFDEGQLAFLGIADDNLDSAKRAMEAHLDGLQRSDGRFDVVLAVQIFTATA